MRESRPPLFLGRYFQDDIIVLFMHQQRPRVSEELLTCLDFLRQR